MAWFRCRALIGDGEYRAYTGSDLGQALEAMDQLPWAAVILVEELQADMTWRDVAGVWRNGRELWNG